MPTNDTMLENIKGGIKQIHEIPEVTKAITVDLMDGVKEVCRKNKLVSKAMEQRCSQRPQEYVDVEEISSFMMSLRTKQ
jgi:hypothetical protein